MRPARYGRATEHRKPRLAHIRDITDRAIDNRTTQSVMDGLVRHDDAPDRRILDAPASTTMILPRVGRC
jgi:hypothetical protein